jgi:hypothetical protein
MKRIIALLRGIGIDPRYVAMARGLMARDGC